MRWRKMACLDIWVSHTTLLWARLWPQCSLSAFDKIVLDAVQNVQDYYHDQANSEEWEVSDKLFSTIFTSYVAAGPELCPLAANNKTAEEYEAAAWEVLDSVKSCPYLLALWFLIMRRSSQSMGNHFTRPESSLP
ncbi:hypothetical protein BDV12DRAFT_159682 [Aspergillus spectabilis]